MTATILQRLYQLAESAPHSLYEPAAQVLRQLISDKDAAGKAHAVTGIVMKLAPAEQERVIAAVESLGKN